MDIVTCDMETFWDTGYSLSKMTTLEYIRDPRFELQLAALKVNGGKSHVFVGENEIRYACKQIPWRKVMALGHNLSGFDAYIMAYILGINPMLWGCTLAMARPIHAKTTGLGLGKLAAYYGVGTKDNRFLLQTKGRYLKDFTPEEVAGMRVYNGDDSDQCYGIFQPLRRATTGSEMWQIDALIRMRTEPRFVVDQALLEAAAGAERDRKRKVMLSLATRLGLTVDNMSKKSHVDWDTMPSEDRENMVFSHVMSELSSSVKFSNLLEGLGVEVPMKPGKPNPDGSEKLIPALAKTDEGFLALQEDPDELVAAAAQARLDAKSTILETRIEKFQTAGRLAGGCLPIPLRYCGADTTGRDSGEEYNPQNMTRIVPGKPKISDALRNSLTVKKDEIVIVADQSGIELRVNHFLWKVTSSMELYRANPAKADLYKAFAAALYAITPDLVNKEQRQVGKVSQLGLGFGAAARTFQRIARVQGGVRLPLEECERIVALWRAEYQAIPKGWKTCLNALPYIEAGEEVAVDPWGLVYTCREGLRLPSGRIIRYPDLRREPGKWPDGRPKEDWVYGHGRHKTSLHGGKMDENMVQALARDSVFDASVNYFKTTKLRPQLRVHDELVYVVPESDAEDFLEELQKELRTPPKWWPELVVWSEGGIAKRYGAVDK